VGFDKPACCQTAGALLPHHFNLTGPVKDLGGVFSVPLSVGSPRLGVTKHPALWSSDFPRCPCEHRGRPACLPRKYTTQQNSLR